MRGLYMAGSAMLTQQAKLNLISNNLANQKSAGYKRDEAAQISFGEWLIRQQGGAGPAQGAGAAARMVGTIAHSVAVSRIETGLTPGAIGETGRALDFALSEGYFTVQSGEGLVYTRNGRFFLDSSGCLVTADNLPVLGERGALFPGADFTVDREGIIYENGRPLDRLRITLFAPGAELEKMGNSYFRLLGGEAAVESGRSPVYWRCLESSNVELTDEMVALLQVRRSFEAAQKMLSTHDQLLERAANELGSLS